METAKVDIRKLQQLNDRGVVAEQYGGDVPVVRTSAKTGEGIDDLLQSVLDVADVYVEPKANPNGPAVGTVIDSHLERGRGPIATLVVQNGTLRVGDNLVAGSAFGNSLAVAESPVTGNTYQIDLSYPGQDLTGSFGFG